MALSKAWGFHEGAASELVRIWLMIPKKDAFVDGVGGAVSRRPASHVK